MTLWIKEVQKYLWEKIIFTFIVWFVFLYCPFTFASDTYSIELEKEKTVIFSYSKDTSKEFLFKSGQIQFSFEGTGIELSQDTLFKNISLKVKDPYTATWKITFSVAQIRYEILVSVNEKLKIKNFDIFPLLTYVRFQLKPLTCESSATADVVSYLLKRNIWEQEIFSALPKSNYYAKLPQRVDWKLIWWNPEEGFVWYETYYKENKKLVLPKQSKMTGYGVYEAPISHLISDTYWLESKIINSSLYTDSYTEKSHMYEVLSELENWNMVILWWDWCTRTQYEDGKVKSKFILSDSDKQKTNNAKNFCSDVGKPRTIKWYYYDGDILKLHSGLSGEHTFYLLGYYGTRENPQKIYVWDTDTGYHSYAIEEWLRKWNSMDNRSLIVYQNKK